MKRLVSQLIWVSALALSLTVTDCGGDGEDSSPTPPPSPGPAPGPVPEPPPAPQPPPANGAKPAVTAVGTPLGETLSVRIDGTGGSVSSADGSLKLTIPAGALGGPTTLGIQPVTNTAPGGGGTSFKLTPDGITFAKPVQLTYRYSDEDLVGTSADALGVAFQQADGTWRMLQSTVDRGAKTVSVNTTHFTAWSMVKGFQLLPKQATVKPGGSVALKAVVCYAPVVGDDELQPLGYRCDSEGEDLAPLLPINPVGNWSVNGMPGGNGAVGTVAAADSRSAAYTAPAQAPSANPVAVGAEVQATNGKVLLVANITVVEADYTGSVLWRMKNSADEVVVYRSSNVAWKQQRLPDGRPVVTPGGDAIYDAAGGTLEITINRPHCTEVRGSVPINAGVLHVHGDNSEVGPGFRRRYYFFLGQNSQVSGASTCQAPGTSASVTTLSADAMLSLEDQCAPDGNDPEQAPPWFPQYTDRTTLAGEAHWACANHGTQTDQSWRFTQ